MFVDRMTDRAYPRKKSIKCLAILGCIFLFCALTSPIYGEIYSWTDAKGVLHFTNYHPPPEAKVFIRDIERPLSNVEVDESLSVGSENPAMERSENPENVEEKVDDVIGRMEKFERTLVDTQVQNIITIERELREANRKAEEALAYAEDLENQIRDITYTPTADYDYLRIYRFYPYRYKYRYPYKIHRPRYKQKRFYPKRRTIGRHFNKDPKSVYHKSTNGRKGCSTKQSVGFLHTQHLSSRHVKKSHRIGARSNTRPNNRHFRR